MFYSSNFNNTGPKDPDNMDDPNGLNSGNGMCIVINYSIEYDFLTAVVQENLKLIKEELEERKDKISANGYNSKERILADEEIKNYIEDSNDNLKKLKAYVFTLSNIIIKQIKINIFITF
jgi:hypothetical protein